MTTYPMLLELGTGTALRSGSYTKAAQRAVQNALWHNSISLAEVFGAQKSDMIVDVEIACTQPDAVDLDAVRAEFPYGTISARAVAGGLDIAKPEMPDAAPTIIAHAAIKVSLNITAKGDMS